LNQEDLERLASAISIRRLPAGSRITQAGEVATTIFLVVEGIFTAETKSRKMGVNQPPTTETLKPGSLIGGNALLNNDTYESTVLSKSAALLCEINQQTLEALLANRPEIAHGLSRRVAEQLVKKQFSTEGGEQDHAKEDDLAAEVFSSLKRRFSGLHAN
jgi:CRP-like cAMP-binding protein